MMTRKESNLQARELLTVGRWLAVERAMTERVLRDDQDFMAHMLLAEAWTGIGRYVEAEASLIRTMHRIPDARKHFAAWRLGDLYRTRGMFESAEGAYLVAVQSAPYDAGYRVLLGEFYFCWGRLEEALSVLSAGLDCTVGPREEVLFNLGIVYRALGSMVDAKSCLEKALEIQDDYPEVIAALEDVKASMLE